MRLQAASACLSPVPIALAIFSRSFFRIQKRFGVIVIGRAMSVSRASTRTFTVSRRWRRNVRPTGMGNWATSSTASREIEYVMLTFEDALFMSPVDGAALNAIADVMVSENLSYVSLHPA